MTRTIIFSFLFFVVPTAVQTLEEPLMTFDNRNSVCYGPGTHGHFRPSCYDENSLMAIRNLKAGAKPLAKGCPGSVTKWTNHSGSYLVDHMDTSKILDESACCIPDYSQDCIFDFNYANSGLSYFYHVSCSGYSECKPNMDVSWQLTSCNNSSIYPSGTNYMFMEYSCINRTKIVNMCSNKSHTASSGTVYLTTPNYPESVKPDIDACKCHIQTNGTKLSFYSIDMRLNKFGNDCKQSLNVTDSDGTTVWDCESAPKFNITEVTFNTQMTVTFYNNLMVDGGQAWIGFSGGEGNILTINCQNEQTSDSTTPFQRTSSTENITTTSLSRTETTESPTSEPTSLSGRKNESQSPISNEQMSTSSTTNPNENGFTESTIKDRNGWSSTTIKGQNGLTDSTIKNDNGLTGSTTQYENGLTESTRDDNTNTRDNRPDTTNRLPTTETQLNSFHQSTNIEIVADLTLMYVIIAVILFGVLITLIVIIIKVKFGQPNQIQCSSEPSNNHAQPSPNINDRRRNQEEPSSSGSNSSMFSRERERPVKTHSSESSRKKVQRYLKRSISMSQSTPYPSYDSLQTQSEHPYDRLLSLSSSGSHIHELRSESDKAKKKHSKESQKMIQCSPESQTRAPANPSHDQLESQSDYSYQSLRAGSSPKSSGSEISVFKIEGEKTKKTQLRKSQEMKRSNTHSARDVGKYEDRLNKSGENRVSSKEQGLAIAKFMSSLSSSKSSSYDYCDTSSTNGDASAVRSNQQRSEKRISQSSKVQKNNSSESLSNRPLYAVTSKDDDLDSNSNQQTAKSRSVKHDKSKNNSAISSDSLAYKQCYPVTSDDDALNSHHNESDKHIFKSTKAKQNNSKNKSVSRSDGSVYEQCDSGTSGDDTLNDHQHKADEHMPKRTIVKQAWQDPDANENCDDDDFENGQDDLERKLTLKCMFGSNIRRMEMMKDRALSEISKMKTKHS